MRFRILTILLLSAFSFQCFAQASGGQIRRQESKPTRIQNGNRRNSTKSKPAVRYEYRFAVYNSLDVFQSIPSFVMAKKEIEALEAKFEKDLKLMQNEYTLHINNYEKTKSKLSKKERAIREEQLQTMYLKIQQAYKEDQESLENESREKMYALYANIDNTAKSIKSEQSIYEVFSQNGVYYSSPVDCLDITNYIINRLGGYRDTKPISFNSSTIKPKIGYVYTNQIPGFNPSENTEFQQSNWERLKRLAKMIAESDGYTCIVDINQLSSYQSEYAFNVTQQLIERYK